MSDILERARAADDRDMHLDVLIDEMVTEIERLEKELESADRIANDWARQNVELRAEIERLRGAYEQERQDCINLTEKVIPNLRVENERLRDHVKFLNSFRPDAELAKRDAEIERLRQEANELNAGWQRTYDHDCALLNTEIELLRGSLRNANTEIERLRNLFIEQAAKNEAALIGKDEKIELLRSLVQEALNGPGWLGEDWCTEAEDAVGEIRR